MVAAMESRIVFIFLFFKNFLKFFRSFASLLLSFVCTETFISFQGLSLSHGIPAGRFRSFADVLLQVLLCHHLPHHQCIMAEYPGSRCSLFFHVTFPPDLSVLLSSGVHDGKSLLPILHFSDSIFRSAQRRAHHISAGEILPCKVPVSVLHSV